MSVELFEDSTNIVEIVEREMAQSTALELDRVALVGSGIGPGTARDQEHARAC